MAARAARRDALPVSAISNLAQRISTTTGSMGTRAPGAGDRATESGEAGTGRGASPGAARNGYGRDLAFPSPRPLARGRGDGNAARASVFANASYQSGRVRN
jgi:hypothetical protein